MASAYSQPEDQCFTNPPDTSMVGNDNDDTPKGESTKDCDCQDEEYVMESESPQLHSQSELNDLVRDLSLSKESFELLAFVFKEITSSFQGQEFPSLGVERVSTYNTLTIKEALCTATISQVFLLKWE